MVVVLTWLSYEYVRDHAKLRWNNSRPPYPAARRQHAQPAGALPGKPHWRARCGLAQACAAPPAGCFRHHTINNNMTNRGATVTFHADDYAWDYRRVQQQWTSCTWEL